MLLVCFHARLFQSIGYTCKSYNCHISSNVRKVEGWRKFEKKVQNFQKFYPIDTEESFPTKCVHFKNFIQNTKDENEKFSATGLFTFILDQDLEELFLNVK